MTSPQILQEGQLVPDFALPASNGRTIRLSELRGRRVILFFYPKNMTPTCTQEACDFRDAAGGFGDYDAVVLGISPDDVKSHRKFADTYELPFSLLADTEHRVCELFGVWQLKKLYGREYMGVVRSTFLIDEDGRLVKAWRNVRVKGHTAAVLEALKEMDALKPSLK